MIEEGDKIPEFILKGIDQSGEEINFTRESLMGGDTPVILYFYPKDSTPGCTTQACDFRDNLNRWAGKIRVIGVSPDSVKSHLKFKEKQSLNFSLISDPEHHLMEPLGVWGEKKLYGKVHMGVIRSTFLIDEAGVVLKKWKNVRAKGHVERILKELKIS